MANEIDKSRLFPGEQYYEIQRLAAQDHPDLQPLACQQLVRYLDHYETQDQQLAQQERHRGVVVAAAVMGVIGITNGIIRGDTVGEMLGVTSIITAIAFSILDKGRAEVCSDPRIGILQDSIARSMGHGQTGEQSA